MDKKVTVKIQDNGIAVLSMNDTEGKNIFSDDFVKDFLVCLDDLIENIRPPVVILKGLSEVFCGGGDKRSLLNLSEGKLETKDLVISERMLEVPCPVIAAMEGHAMGGGLMVAACSDIVIAGLESRYGAVFMSMGFTPGMGCTTLLRDLVGSYVANEMMYTAKRFKGKELVNKATNINYILPRSEVMPKAVDIALQIAEKNIKSVYILKRTLSARKKKMLIDARLQEDLMHQLSFSFEETKKIINEFYVE